MAQSVRVAVEGRQLKLSNLGKVFYPKVGFTKGQVIDYYTRIAPVLLPHLRMRALTLKRYPDGVEGEYFYEKQCPGHRPDWVETARIRSESKREWIDFCVANDLPTLVWLANLADLELHASLALANDYLCPTVVAFDLDPGEPAGLIECAQVALWLKELLQSVGLTGFVKTSGSKGMQVYVPLNTPVKYQQTKPFAHAIARLLEREHSSKVVSKMAKNLRSDKVFVDWSQNSQSKTTVCVYSLRARDRPTVSTPLNWEELSAALDVRDPALLVFESDAVLERAERLGDPFEAVLTLKQKLPAEAVA